MKIMMSHESKKYNFHYTRTMDKMVSMIVTSNFSFLSLFIYIAILNYSLFNRQLTYHSSKIENYKVRLHNRKSKAI